MYVPTVLREKSFHTKFQVATLKKVQFLPSTNALT